MMNGSGSLAIALPVTLGEKELAVGNESSE